LQRIIFGIFIVLHGLVHLFYFGQSRRLFDLQAEMVWPDGSWAFSRLLGDQTARSLASICCVLAAIGFVAAGVGIFAKQEWWRPAIVVSAVFSSAIFFVFWDGKLRRLADHGFVGILINVAILVAVLVLQWPDLGF
jgi:hypothetical protein